ncbi:MAG: ATP-binding cassette domain-containing protein [Actinobacteria bacterium]|nr:ATP-binding cassette domain-containing protein [Actinomycetota bacterium]
MPTDRTVVDVDSVTKRYGEVVAVDNATFGLPAGSITGFLGPNGAGKTTTLRLLLGLSEPTSGQALVFGRRFRDLDQPMQTVGAVLESDDFDPGRGGRDHLRVLARAGEVPEERVDAVLDVVGLTSAGGRRVRTYSLGMRQRLGVAAAVLGEPQLLVLDEPANGLDPQGMQWLRSFLRSFAEGGGTVLISSHVLAEVAQTVDQVVIINHGEIVADSPLAALTSKRVTLEDIYIDLINETTA